MTTATLLKLLTNKTTYIVLLVITLLGSIYVSKQLKKENIRFTHNQTLLLEKNVEANRRLILTTKEFQELVAQDRAFIAILKDSLDIQARQIASLKKVKSKTRVVFKTEVRDSIVYRTDTITAEPVAVPIQYFKWEDPWTTVAGEIYNRQVDIEYNSTDTLYMTVHWERVGKFLPCIFGKKQYQSNVTNTNPHVNSVIDENITVLKGIPEVL
jgi:hypothetical protein